MRASAAENMAMDEALFITVGRGDSPPTFRVYGWERPAVSLGRFQDAEKEVDLSFCQQQGIEVVLRPTGGRAVYHGDDVTYALVATSPSDLFPDSIPETYAIISRALAEGLKELGVPVTFGRRDGQEKCYMESFCFSRCAPAELSIQGRKIMGSAQVRGRRVFLQHGSLLIKCDFERIYGCFLPHHEERQNEIERLKSSITSVSEYLSDLEGFDGKVYEAWKRALVEELNISFEEGNLTEEEWSMVHTLLREKYHPWRERFLLS